MLTLIDGLRPKLFVSYSRRQSGLAEDVRVATASFASAVWFDRDEITVGDRWMDEIEAGIAASDELIAIITEDALNSPVVQHEIDVAERLEKIIRPLVLEGHEAGLPERLKASHYLVYSGPEDLESLLNILAEVPVTDSVSTSKLALTRRVEPAFDYGLVKAPSEQLKGLSRLAEHMAKHAARDSTVRLNAGLLAAMQGRWPDAIEFLRGFAEARGSFAAWYFYGLHLPGGGPSVSLRSEEAELAIRISDRVDSFGPHPLGTPLAMVLRVGAGNHGMPEIARAFELMKGMAETDHEEPSEYARFFWALRASFVALGKAGDDLKDYIRRRAK